MAALEGYAAAIEVFVSSLYSKTYGVLSDARCLTFLRAASIRSLYGP